MLNMAVERVAALYDPAHALLAHPTNKRFRVVRESLCFAALLTLRSRTESARAADAEMAVAVIDAVLKTQIADNQPDAGSFPLLIDTAAPATILPDYESRLLIGTILALRTRNFEVLLGKRRVAAMLRAAAKSRACSDDARAAAATATPPGLSGALVSQMLDAWLGLEFGDYLRGDALAVEILEKAAAADAADERARARWCSPASYGALLWAATLWRSSSRLAEPGEALLVELYAEIAFSVHPTLPSLFGMELVANRKRNEQFAWLSVWLGWLALGHEPALPKHLPDPLDATLYALPALVHTQPPGPRQALFRSVKSERTLAQSQPGGELTGWFEPGLHIEASRGSAGRSTTVVGARWRTLHGTARLTCSVQGACDARCQHRAVQLNNAAHTQLQVSDLTSGQIRMDNQSWWLEGLHLEVEGFDLREATRTKDGLVLRLAPRTDTALLRLKPIV